MIDTAGTWVNQGAFEVSSRRLRRRRFRAVAVITASLATVLAFSGPAVAASWIDNDLNVLASSPGQVSAMNALDGYWASGDNSQHVNYTDSATGDVHELYWAGGGGSWVDNNLTALAQNGVPAASGSALDGYPESSDGSQHVQFLDASGNVHELYWAGSGGPWVDNNLTALASSTSAAAGSALNGYWESSDNSQHVNYIDASGHVHELYLPGPDCFGGPITPSTCVSFSWADNNLTEFASSTGVAVPAAGALGGYPESSDGSQHVNYIDESGHVHELFFP